MISQCPHSWLLHLYHVLHLNDFLSIFHPHSYTHFKGLSVLTYSAQFFNIDTCFLLIFSWTQLAFLGTNHSKNIVDPSIDQRGLFVIYDPNETRLVSW